MTLITLLIIPIAYLLGSIPSAYIVGRLLKGIDIRDVGDGRIGTSYSFRRLGFTGGMTVAFMDFGKGVTAVLLAQSLTDELAIVLLASLVVVVGHNWSVFLHFQGGKGAATTYGVLASLIFWQLLIGLVTAGIVYFFTHKAGLATGIMFGTLPLVLWIYGASISVVTFPAFLSLPMLLKHHLMIKTLRKMAKSPSAT